MQVDWSAPLASGLIGALVPSTGRELVNRVPLTVGASTALTSTAWGVAGEQTANGVPAYSVALGAYPAEMSFVLLTEKYTGTSSRAGLAVFNNNGTTEAAGGFAVGFSLGSGSGFDNAGTNGNRLTALDHGVAWRFGAVGATLTDGPATYAGTRATGGTALNLYVNGLLLTGTPLTLAGTPLGTLTATIGTSNTGSRGSGAGRCGVAALFVWSRVLSTNEIAAIHADPFQMFRR
jgi:hypothetical protein